MELLDLATLEKASFLKKISFYLSQFIPDFCYLQPKVLVNISLYTHKKK